MKPIIVALLLLASFDDRTRDDWFRLVVEARRLSPGAEPAIIRMHGFPDNVHLYDRLSPYLSPPRRVVLFDFLGWGSSDKPSGLPLHLETQDRSGSRTGSELQLGGSQAMRKGAQR